jgi:hypothetical protein
VLVRIHNFSIDEVIYLFFIIVVKERSSTFSISSISVFLICIFGLGVIAVFKNYVRQKSFVKKILNDEGKLFRCDHRKSKSEK